MKIGIIGSGDVGRALGSAFAAINHQVMIGSRTPDSDELKAWMEKTGKRACTGSVTNAAAFADLIVLAVNWTGVEDTLQQVRPEAAGKVVIDVTNPLEFSGTEPPRLALGHTISGGEVVQQLLPDSHVVKTLNIVNYAHMAHPKYYEGTPVMFYCGNNPSAKKTVSVLLRGLGWHDTSDLGDITNSRTLEPLCLLWITYGMAHNTWDHAFAVLKK